MATAMVDVMETPGRIVRPLLAWYARAKRDLPWRRSRDPYAVWVSEVMLQQTQVERVRDFFVRFMERFPTVHALAAAREPTVLKHWEGLGYYRRARQLHAAAKRLVADHGGVFPRSVDGLRSLPGIGRYTAGAIASIAFDLPEPIVEANSRRVIARLVGHDSPLDGPGGDGPIWEIASRLVPKRQAGRFNQALMDLGAMVCTPDRPLCGRCPFAKACVASATGRVDVIPAKSKRAAVKRLRETALIIRHGGSVLVERRGRGAWWEGLWDFPRVDGAAAKQGRGIGNVAYTVTHHRIECAVREQVARRRKKASAGQRWVPIDGLATLAMTAPGRRIATMISKALPP
ncbi:MAG: A/G-specific adenine glycosylase [Planctomycetia bacterium]